MDPALPPGGLYQIFQQYDAIRSHSTKDDGPPPWEPEEDKEQDVNPSAPKPVDLSNKSTPAAPAAPTEVTGFITPLAQDDGKVTVDGPGPPQQVLTDATRARPKGRPKAWAEDAETKKREAIGARNMQFAIDHPNRGTFAGDETGLELAYHDVNHPTSYDPKNEGTYYDPSSRTLYVRGSVTTQDWIDDVTKIPNWGDSRDIEMYKNAKSTYDRLISQGKPVDRVVGHSLGGSVALQLQKDKDIPYSRTFGAPVMQLSPFEHNAERYRHPLDPFSIFDRSATNISSMQLNTHSYGGFTNNTSVFGKFLGI
jgi:hypothetical protein